MTEPPKPTIDPVRWTPPPDRGLRGLYARNDALAAAQVWRVPGDGPEDVVVDDRGTVYTGTEDGSLFAISDNGDVWRRITRTGGRPLGVELLTDGRLLVCDADHGLLAVDRDSGHVEELVTVVDGERLRLVNNATVADDGTIYFTDSSRRFSLQHWKGDLLEHRGTGRLLRRTPDGRVETLLDGVQFANGVAMAADGRSVYLAETGMYRILQIRLSGDRQGEVDVFAQLPALPDNLSVGPTGTLWCAAASDRLKAMDTLADKRPALRRAIWALPDALQPAPSKVALVFGYNVRGRLTHNLQLHGDERFTVATGVREHDGHLYVGSLVSSCLLRYRLSGVTVH